MLELVLLPLVAFAFTTLVGYVMLRWATRTFGRFVEEKHRATESIINFDMLPPEWLEPYRQRMEQAQDKGLGSREIERIAWRGRKQCVRNLNELSSYIKRSGFVDSETTRTFILEALEKQRQGCLADGWQERLGLEGRYRQPDH
jgi:hypothetical protein